VYAAHELPDARRTTDLWRELAIKAGLRGLHLVAVCQNKVSFDPAASGFDAIAVCNQVKISEAWPKSLTEARMRRLRAAYRTLRGWPEHVYRYEDAIPYFLTLDGVPDVTRYPAVIPGWDNTPRSGLNGVVLHEATPELFGLHAREAVAQVRRNDPERRIVFLKSWNEWAEGNYLEPDLRWGRAFLEQMRDAKGVSMAASGGAASGAGRIVSAR
jgi:hypothetical protein